MSGGGAGIGGGNGAGMSNPSGSSTPSYPFQNQNMGGMSQPYVFGAAQPGQPNYGFNMGGVNANAYQTPDLSNSGQMFMPQMQNQQPQPQPQPQQMPFQGIAGLLQNYRGVM